MAHLGLTSVSELEKAINQIIDILDKFADNTISEASLNSKDFERFMNTELGSYTKNQKDPQILQKMMKSVDGTVDGKKDGRIDIQEFFNLMGGMMVACHGPLLMSPPSNKNPNSGKKPTEMECAMETIVRVFKQYAGKKGKKDQMDYIEFEEFMKTELKSFTDKDPSIVCRLMESVDGSSDGKHDKKINIHEFMNLIGKIAVASHSDLCHT